MSRTPPAPPPAVWPRCSPAMPNHATSPGSAWSMASRLRTWSSWRRCTRGRSPGAPTSTEPFGEGSGEPQRGVPGIGRRARGVSTDHRGGEARRDGGARSRIRHPGGGARVDADQLRVMEVDGEFASVLRLSRMPQYWLGRPAPSGQVLSLATSLEHGGRGYGLALLEGMLAELHEAGVPTVTLQPSTARFYRTAGFEFAGSWNIYEVDCEHVPPLDRAYRVRRLPGDELGPIMKLYEQVAPTRHGAFMREEWWWRVALTRPRPNEGKEAVNLLLETEDGPVGWAMLAFGAEMGSANEPFALRVRIQDWGWRSPS